MTLRQGLVSVAILVHLAAIVLVQIPSGRWALAETVRPLFAPYLRTVDLSQGWALFAPDPPTRTARLDARIRFADGQVRTCALNVSDMRFERWESMLGADDSFRRARPDAALWFAHLAPGARQVTLIAHRVDLARPDIVFLPQDHFPVFPQQAVVYDTLVTP